MVPAPSLTCHDRCQLITSTGIIKGECIKECDVVKLDESWEKSGCCIISVQFVWGRTCTVVGSKS